MSGQYLLYTDKKGWQKRYRKLKALLAKDGIVLAVSFSTVTNLEASPCFWRKCFKWGEIHCENCNSKSDLKACSEEREVVTIWW